jgi:hypothetical protein
MSNNNNDTLVALWTATSGSGHYFPFVLHCANLCTPRFRFFQRHRTRRYFFFGVPGVECPTALILQLLSLVTVIGGISLLSLVAPVARLGEPVLLAQWITFGPCCVAGSSLGTSRNEFSFFPDIFFSGCFEHFCSPWGNAETDAALFRAEIVQSNFVHRVTSFSLCQPSSHSSLPCRSS